MKKINFYQIKEKQFLKGFNFDISLEVNFDGETIYGNLGGYDHHTKENENNPSPCNNKNIHNMSESRSELIKKILIIEADLDVLFASVAIVYNKELQENNLFEHSIWASVEKVDKKGVRAFEEDGIPERDRYIMESIWAAKKKALLPSFYQKEGVKIMDVTDFMYEHLEFIYDLLTDEKFEKNKDLIQEWKENLEKKIDEALVVENSLIRVFNTSGVSVNNAYFSKELNKNVPLILSYNSSKKSIRLSTCDEKFNCKDLVQKYWGVSAGGHAGIGASPRKKELSYIDLFQFFEFLNKEVGIRN